GVEHAEHAVPELTNFLIILKDNFGGVFEKIYYHRMMDTLFSFIVILMLAIVVIIAAHRYRKIPTGFQCLLEMYVKFIDDLAQGVIGPKGRGFTPFIGTIFIYIITMNFMGLIPFMKSPIALNYNVPLSLAVVVLFTVQYHGIRSYGLKGYLKHFTVTPWWMNILMVPIHLLEEFAVKPGSLSLRLFGNITGEDVVIAALVILTAAALPAVLPLPVQALFFPLALLFSILQAFIFTILSTVYLAQFTAHEEHY
ncbi:MAG: F0F1 ATP synthase subunit A, partial [bacterium]